MNVAKRPRAPHLTVYRPQIMAFTSILHRAMNSILLGGTVVFAAWVIAIAAGGMWFALFQQLWASFIGKLALFVWTFAGFYFVFQWLHHFVWDLGFAFELEQARLGAWLVLILSSVSTLACWTWLL